MSNAKTMTLAEMRPLTRIGYLCLFGFMLAIPWIGIYLFIRMPNRLWAILAGEIAAMAAARLAFLILQRRALAEGQASESSPVPEHT